MRVKFGPIIASLAFVICLSCAAQNQTRLHKVDKNPFDRKVDIGGLSLHISCTKLIKNAPIVVFEAGLNQGSETWDKVQPDIGEFARTCVYDRAGLGKSDAPPQPLKTSMLIVSDLHNLLEKSGLRGPFILAGHSFGGLTVRLFASKYPTEVVGVVLVDSVHERESQRWLEMIPPDVRKQMEAAGGQRMLGGEPIDLAESMKQMIATDWQTDIPLVVLVRGKASYNPEDYPPTLRSLAPKGEELRIEMQKDLASRSSRGKLVFAEKSGHFIQQDEPDLVVQSVREVIDSVRSRKTFTTNFSPHSRRAVPRSRWSAER